MDVTPTKGADQLRQYIERIERLEEQGIDPSAIFYTELDAMPTAEQRIQRARAGDDDPLW